MIKTFCDICDKELTGQLLELLNTGQLIPITRHAVHTRRNLGHLRITCEFKDDHVVNICQRCAAKAIQAILAPEKQVIIPEVKNGNN